MVKWGVAFNLCLASKMPHVHECVSSPTCPDSRRIGMGGWRNHCSGWKPMDASRVIGQSSLAHVHPHPSSPWAWFVRQNGESCGTTVRDAGNQWLFFGRLSQGGVTISVTCTPQVERVSNEMAVIQSALSVSPLSLGDSAFETRPIQLWVSHGSSQLTKYPWNRNK